MKWEGPETNFPVHSTLDYPITMKHVFLFTAVASFVLLMAGCARGPYAATNKSYKRQAKAYAKIIERQPVSDSLTTGPWVGTTNFGLRKPNFVIIHHTAQKSCEQTLKTFTMPRTSVSAHYVICEDGTVYHMLNDYLRAWHAGVGKWGNDADINSSSIGIEIDNDGFEPFTDAQINSLLTVLGGLKKTYGIPTANFIGHADIAPTRKNDPNVHFPWKMLADKGFGLWWKDTTSVVVPQNFDNLVALRVIGYDMRDTTAVIKTFKRKYLQQENDSLITEPDRKILYTLYNQFR